MEAKLDLTMSCAVSSLSWCTRLLRNIKNLFILEQWIQKIEAYNDWYVADDGFGVDEKKRPGKPKTQEDLFGVEGSFRKLEID